MDSSLLKCLVLVGAVSGVYSYASGAPASACTSMMPGHNGVSPQTSASQYTITASSTTYQPNQQITVTISGGVNHQGLLLQARKSGSTTPIGTFSTPSANTKLTLCTAAGDSWTHSDTTNKQTSTVMWTAPSTDMGQITFRATVATNKNTYWMNQESQALAYMAGTTMSNANIQTTTDNGCSVIQLGIGSVLAVAITAFYLL